MEPSTGKYRYTTVKSGPSKTWLSRISTLEVAHQRSPKHTPRHQDVGGWNLPKDYRGSQSRCLTSAEDSLAWNSHHLAARSCGPHFQMDARFVYFIIFNSDFLDHASQATSCYLRHHHHCSYVLFTPISLQYGRT